MTRLSTTDAATLHQIIASAEDWLLDHVLAYALRQGYTRYSSTLREAWRLSVHGLSSSVLSALEEGSGDVELTPDEDFTTDPLAQFGIVEAMRHQQRGVSLPMFLGLLKYYRQSYRDLIEKESLDQERCRRLGLVIERVFDRIEIGFCTAWNAPSEAEQLAELQLANREMTNEKNKYLTIFESLQSPVAVLNREKKITDSNHAWKVLFDENTLPGADYYAGDHRSPATWLLTEVERFIAEEKDEIVLDKAISTDRGQHHFLIRIKRMLDISDKFTGCVIILDDATSQKTAEQAARDSERLEGVLELAGAVCHDLNQPLMAISGYAEIIMMDAPEDAPYFIKLKKMVDQVNKLGDITKKLMRVTRYETKTYLDKQIIDIEKASGEE